MPYPDMIKKPKNQTKNAYIYKVSKKICKKVKKNLQSKKIVVSLQQKQTTKTRTQ